MGTSLQAFLSVLPYLVMVGLLADMVGAILVLGPEVKSFARIMTRRDRRNILRLLDQLEETGYIDDSFPSFEKLQIALAQGMSEGETFEPAREEDYRGGIESEFNVIEKIDDMEELDPGYYLTKYNEGVYRSVELDGLRSFARTYTATANDFYYQGAFLLLTGFFLQFVGVLAEQHRLTALAIFLVGGTVISYEGYTRFIR